MRRLKLLVLIACSLSVISTVLTEHYKHQSTRTELFRDVIAKLLGTDREMAKVQKASPFNQDRSIRKSFLNFGTHIKNFFKIKSDRPTPRPRDHIPVVVVQRR